MRASGQAPENDPAAQPRRIGDRYRLTDALGQGAMGTVWAGYDEVLHRSVAIKELRVPPGIPASEMVAMRERMMREARTLGGLSHPNVITLYDVVDVSGNPYVVLELLPSRNLSEVIDDQGPLSVGQAASTGLAVAAALQAAHRAGITHRDVKPGNVLIAHDGRIKLTDFGIARKRDDHTMTATGLVLGSPAYISPEVAAGEEVTPAADLWGLGVTLFASVEGRPPYDVEGDPVKTMTAVVHDDVPRPTISGPLAEVISALMVKEPDGRLPLTEVRRRLRPLLTDPDDPLFPGSPEAYTTPPLPAVPRDSGSVRSDSRSAQAPGRAAGTGSPGRGSGPHGTVGPRPSAPPAPLAADPGPLPGSSSGWARPPASPTPSSGAFPPSHQAPDPAGGYPTPDHSGGYPAPDQSGGPPAAFDRYPPAPSDGYPPRSAQPPPRPPRPSMSAPLPAERKAGAGSRALPLLLAGALAVTVGAAGGWAAARTLVGQSPLSTALISPGASTPASPLQTHFDAPRVYGPSALGFTVGVPRDWEEYRLAAEGDAVSVLFVSPDGSRELRIDKLRGSRARPAQPSDFIDGLTANRLGVAAVTVEQQSANQVRYRVDRVGPGGTSSRVGYAQLTLAGLDLWVVGLMVPADAAGDASQQLFTSITQGFHP